MAEVNYDTFLNEVLPFAPNCSEPQAVNAIRNACVEFCQRTNFLQDDMDPITVQAGVGTYDIDVTTDYVLGTIMSLYWDTMLLPRKSQAEIEKTYGLDWQSVSTSTPVCFTQFNPDQFTVCFTPSEILTNGFTGRISRIPARASTTVDETLLERYSEEIAAGALARILRTPNEPYSSPQAAMAYLSKFNTAVQEAASYVRGGMNRAPLRVHLKRLV